jgi:hypothetical protein
MIPSMLISCTQNERARTFGGSEIVEVPKNHVILTATWKENQLWVLSKDTTTNEMMFWEKSSFGVIQGEVKFK